MITRKLSLAFFILSCGFLADSRPICAQEEPQPPSGEAPKPAGSSSPVPLLTVGNIQDQANDSGFTPDLTPLTGVQNPTIGSPEVRHSYWQPGIQWSGAIQSSPYNQTPGSNWVTNNFFAGTLSLLNVSSRSQLALNYSGGGYVSNDSTQGNGYYHQLSASQTFLWGRWVVQLLDQFSYLPQSSFGFGGGTSLGLPGTSGSVGPTIPGINGNYVPNQSIFSAIGARYSNAATVQLTYTITPRGSVTVSGSYGLLNFVQSGNVNNDMTTGTIGYNYALSRDDSIGAFYRFSAFHFSGQPVAYGDHSANLAYSRKITARVALQLYGGPSFTTSRGNGTGTTYGENVGASLTYNFHRGSVNLNYTHGVNGGSGVLTGSTGDLLNASVNHRLGRIWSGQLNMGYSHNAPFGGGPQTNTATYNTWNAGGGVNRDVGHNGTLAIAYNATFTDYGLAGCTGAACSSSQTYHYITLNFQWHTRPFVLH